MIITVDPDRSFHDRVTAAVLGEPWSQMSFHVADPDEASGVVGAHATPTLLVIGPRVPFDEATDVTRRVMREGVPVYVLIVTDPTNEALHAAMRAGARDVLPPGFSDDELKAAIDRTGLPDSNVRDRRVVTVAVFSAKGGVGTSTIAANLASRIAVRTRTDTVLVDLDVASADQSVMHALTPQWTLQDLADGTISTDPESLRGVLLPIDGTTARLLPGPLDPALAETISGDAVARVIGAAWSVAPVVVLDTASSFDDRTLAALDAADIVVVASSLDVAALRALSVSLQTLARIGVPDTAVRVALVRADSKSGLHVGDVERTIGRDVDVRIPSSRAVVRSVNEGVALAVSAPRSGYVQAIDELIDDVLAVAPAELRDADEVPSTGWFGLVGRGRRSSDGDTASEVDQDVAERIENASGNGADRVPPSAAGDGDVGDRPRSRRSGTQSGDGTVAEGDDGDAAVALDTTARSAGDAADRNGAGQRRRFGRGR